MPPRTRLTAPGFTRWLGSFAAMFALILAGCASGRPGHGWEVHDMNRPTPPVLTPAGAVTAAPPPDAIVLFDGRNLDQWAGDEGPARWTVFGGAATVNKTGSIRTRQTFGDCQLHLEFTTPDDAESLTKSGQNRGNSGVFFMGRYEVQILDSYNNRTYADGQCASLYGQYPPLVNASLPPGQWQSYDIIFRRPRFSSGGRLLSPAMVTVIHNGVVVQNQVPLMGATAHKQWAKYSAHEDALPLMLQDHGDPVRFRNIWIRELADNR